MAGRPRKTPLPYQASENSETPSAQAEKELPMALPEEQKIEEPNLILPEGEPEYPEPEQNHPEEERESPKAEALNGHNVHHPEKNPPADFSRTIKHIPQGLQIIETAPHDRHIRAFRDENDKSGILCYWRKTRRMEHFRWINTGRWSDALTHQTLSFVPMYWKDARTG